MSLSSDFLHRARNAGDSKSRKGGKQLTRPTKSEPFFVLWHGQAARHFVALMLGQVVIHPSIQSSLGASLQGRHLFILSGSPRPPPFWANRFAQKGQGVRIQHSNNGYGKSIALYESAVPSYGSNSRCTRYLLR
ncbi:hypothetical protein V2G26_009260 [Clonostachys chloroleuca]